MRTPADTIASTREFLVVAALGGVLAVVMTWPQARVLRLDSDTARLASI